jgi:hypothetical protein
MMTLPFRVHIHLGAHKTATTFIQNGLAQQHDWLRERHIAYIPLHRLRQEFTPCFWELTNGQATDPVALMARMRTLLLANVEASGYKVGDTRLLILSEENLLGALGALYHRGVLYPDLAKRMQYLAEIFQGCEVQAFLSVRNYRDFYASAYAEVLRQGWVKPMDQFVAKLDLSGNTWPNVVAAIEAALGPVTVWPYEQFRSHTGEIISALLQTEVGADFLGKQIVRPSLTQKGLAVAMACRDVLEPADLKKLVNTLVDKVVFEQPDGRIVLGDDGGIGALEARYWGELEGYSLTL